MIDFFTRLFGREPSGATAKERLRLVLLSDHLALAPDVVEALRADLIEVISRYVDIDPGRCDVTFEQQDRAIAMMANVPVIAMKPRPSPPPPPPPAPPAPPSGPSGGTPEAASPTTKASSVAGIWDEPAGSAQAAPQSPSAEETVAPSVAGGLAGEASAGGNGSPARRARRRRRRKAAGSGVPAPAG